MAHIAIIFLTLMTVLCPAGVHAQDTSPKTSFDCKAEDKPCLLGTLLDLSSTITEPQWRDQTYRETAKLMTAAGMTDDALSLIPKVENPDTRAMTIRGIGMAAAALKLNQDDYNKLFARLTDEAFKIEHPPSHAIALTYIAMSQAFALDDAGAAATAAKMTNAALRNKAHAENAEIQAERGDLAAAMASIKFIDDASFQNKAYGLISKILADRAVFSDALSAATAIENAYQKSQAILYIVGKQTADAGIKVSAE